MAKAKALAITAEEGRAGWWSGCQVMEGPECQAKTLAQHPES